MSLIRAMFFATVVIVLLLIVAAGLLLLISWGHALLAAGEGQLALFAATCTILVVFWGVLIVMIKEYS